MKTKILPLILFLCLYSVAALASVTVSVSQPANNSTVGTSLEVKANACCNIDGWYIYVDGKAAWSIHSQPSIDAHLIVPVGLHQLAVRAWDKTGAYGTAYLMVNVVNQGSITVVSPTVGATVQSPVTFSATATSPNGIDGWEIYANNQTVYSQPNGATLNTQLTMPAGVYTVMVRAWDKVSGYVSSPTFSLTVAASPAPEPPAASLTAPSTALVFNNVQSTPDSTWTGTSSEAGPTNVTNDFWTSCCSTAPSLTGASRQFHVGGPAWTAALFYHKMGNNYNSITHILTDYWIYVDAASMPYIWDMEFDAYQSLGGYEYMMGTHCLLGKNWQGWDQLTGAWLDLNAPCSRAVWTVNTWHHVQWLMERVPNSTKYQYDTLVVDGVAYTLNLQQPAGPSDWGDVLGVQWQTDTNGSPGTVNWWIDKVTVSLW